MSCLKLIDEFFIKNNLDIRIIKPINKTTKYSFPDESEMDLIYSKYKPDIEYYKRMFNYAKL